jgi:tetratricopeptide (TPR) repeat protein
MPSFPRFLMLLSLAALCVRAGADTIRLNDGTSVEGSAKRNGDVYDVTDAAGKVTHIPVVSVKGIDIGNKVPGALEAESRLLSLRRSAENTTDIKAILERYERFIEQNKETTVSREAENDAAIWRDRLAKGLVKVGQSWVTVAEREQMQARSAEIAEVARQLLRQGRMREAEPLIQQILDADPANPSALYLRGLVLFRHDQIVAARKAFEGVVASMKDHAATLNNLAVVLWKQNQQLPAMNAYVQAMLASPLNREILNNVAEALSALPQNHRSSPVAQKCFKIFAEQDTALQEQLARQGLYRWGSTWVDKAQIVKLQEMEKEIGKKLDAMSAEYDDTKKKIGRIEDDIDDNVRRMRAIEATSFARDAQGNVYRLPYPRHYYDLDDDNKKLSADRTALIAHLDELRAGAKKVQQQIPTPRFTGVQQMIGVEQTPLLPPLPTPAATAATAGRTDLLPPKDVVPVDPQMPLPTTTSRPATGPAEPATQPYIRRPIPDSLLTPN